MKIRIKDVHQTVNQHLVGNVYTVTKIRDASRNFPKGLAEVEECDNFFDMTMCTIIADNKETRPKPRRTQTLGTVNGWTYANTTGNYVYTYEQNAVWG